MLELEGTRNERVFVVVSSYVIGFVTAYICFGVTELQRANEETSIASYTTVERTERAPQAGNTIVNAAASAGQVAAVYKAGKLEITTGNEVKTVSVSVDILDAASLQALSDGPGVHTELAFYTLSPSARYLYFCEEDDLAGSCTAYMYDAESNMIRNVTINSALAMFDAETAASATWSNGRLVIGANSSVSAEEPWKLATGE